MTVSRLEFATETRDELQRLLTTPVQGWIVATGQRHESPPINQAFHLEAVEIDSSKDYPRLIVKFRWDGESDVFAVSYRVDPDDDDFNWGDGAAGFAMSTRSRSKRTSARLATRWPTRYVSAKTGSMWLRWNSPRWARPPA